MIRAIIFDCFGVLTTDGWLPFKHRHFGHDDGLKLQATDLNKLVDAGLADYGDFIQAVAKLAHISPAEARDQIENNVADQELFGYIRDNLKPSYQLGLLSNAGANWLGTLFSADQVALFDAVSLSCDTGFVKPDSRSYATIAAKLGVPPEDCVFIDDQPRYCSAAQDAGMRAITYKNFAQCRTELEVLLHAANPARQS